MHTAESIRFVPETHTYYLGDRQLTSVTTVIKTVVPEFDRERISRTSAAKKGVSQAELLEEWDRKAQAALVKGTRVHAYAEDVIDGVYDPILSAVNERFPEMDAFDRAWAMFREKLNARVIAKETIVADAALGVAGRVDVILGVTVNGAEMRACWDWKTGKFETTNRWEKLRPPFQDLDNCSLNVYSLQTSLYRLMLERKGDAVYGPSYLVHLSDTGEFRVYRGLDLRERVREWLEKTTSRG